MEKKDQLQSTRFLYAPCNILCKEGVMLRVAIQHRLLVVELGPEPMPFFSPAMAPFLTWVITPGVMTNARELTLFFYLYFSCPSFLAS